MRVGFDHMLESQGEEGREPGDDLGAEGGPVVG